MSSLIQYFAAIVGFIREKAKIDITMDILVKYVFELRKTCPYTGRKMFYQHTVTLSQNIFFKLHYNIHVR